MKHLLILATGLLLTFTASSQILKPVTWSYAAKKTSATEATVFIKATLNDGWHIYSQKQSGAGPVKATFTFDQNKGIHFIGKVNEPKPISKYEKTFGTNVSYFEKEVIFQQKIKLKDLKAVVSGSIEFMICSDKQCLPPDTLAFSIPVS